MLIRQLPRDAATTIAVAGEAVRWGETEHLLAVAIDTLRAANWQRAGDRNAPRPEPLRRPGEARRSRLTSQQINDRLQRQLRRRRG